MILNAWRTLILEPHELLLLRDNMIVVRDEDREISIPIGPLREILITSNIGSISLPLLTALAEQGTKVLFCDEKRNPVCELNGISFHTESAGRLMDQSSWTQRRKDAVWRQIVAMKILRQADVLERVSSDICTKLRLLRRQVKQGDQTNREAVASRLYFSALFGDVFKRFADDSINNALNYGYTILCSAFNRTITFHGYHTALGIHHCSRCNRFNLSADLMEPFRPFIDEVVYMNGMRELDWAYKKELIVSLQAECLFDGHKTTIANAIDGFVIDFIRTMGEPRRRLKEVCFVKKSKRYDGHL